MLVRESFYRPDTVLGRESRELSARVYNLAHLLLHRCTEPCLFVPIRSMQYLAVLDRDEIIFVDANNRPYIELAWQDFRPQNRAGLDDPVPFDLVYYLPQGSETMRRLVGEFQGALAVLERKLARAGRAEEPVSLHSSTKPC